MLFDTKRNMSYKFNKSRTILFVLNRNEIVAIITIHCDEFDTNICKMNDCRAITFTINKIDIIINTVATLENKDNWCMNHSDPQTIGIDHYHSATVENKFYDIKLDVVVCFL